MAEPQEDIDYDQNGNDTQNYQAIKVNLVSGRGWPADKYGIRPPDYSVRFVEIEEGYSAICIDPAEALHVLERLQRLEPALRTWAERMKE